ncbi:hypothetical protein LSAT2_029350 [Lamellibrachia satsuma]|nr:hypothetical protein LSAT2_029350 [Lamellibrachia satsuma]
MGCNASKAVDVSNTIASVPKGTQTGVSLVSLKAVLQAASQTDSEPPQHSVERHTDSVPNSTGDSQSNLSIKDTTTSEVSPDIHDASSVGDISANREEEDKNNNKENYQQEDVIQVFTEFPEPTLLQNANEIATRNNQSIRVDDEGNTPPYPCPTWKKEVFNAKEFVELDAFAVGAPEEKCLGTMADLVDYLTHPPSHVPQSAGSGEMSDVSKARVLFRWITAQDLNSLNATADASLDSPLGHLRNIKEEKGVYSALYVAMCRAAGLMCTELRGCVKSVNYQPGDETVLVDGVWRLVDVKWAARHVTGNDREDWILVDDNGKGAKDVTAELSSLKYAYNEFYFFTDPYQFIYSHIPDTEAWQLLARMVTLSEFGEIAYLKPAFFELGLRIVSDRKCVMHTINGEAELVIGLPEGAEQRSFVYELWQSRDTVKQRRRNVGSSLERYVFMQQIEGQLRCKITLPTAGQFMMKLYAQDPARETNKQSFSYACAYIIHCSSPKPDCVPIPANKRQEWGPGHDLTRLGLTALTHTNGMIEVENGEAEIRFKADKKVQVQAKLHSNTKDVSELRQHIVHRYEDGEVILNVKLPESGEYALNLYAKDDTVDDCFTNPCSYLLTAKTQAADPTPFPEFPNGEVGATDEATDIHFEAVSHPTCFIEAPSTGELEMTFKADPCVMTTELILQTPDTHQIVQDHVLHWQRSTGDISLVARFPEPGLYALKLFAKSQDAEGSSMPNVYNYVVTVSSPKEDCLPFPEAYSKWKNLMDKKIIEPRNGMLPPHQSVKFVARIPTAVKVATIAKSGWTYLTKEEDDIWSGDVETGDGGNEIKLSALFEEGSNTYSMLLTYMVSDEIAGSDAEDISDDDDKEDEVSTEPETDEELVPLTQFTEEFHPFTEFPEPKLLKMANDVFTGYNKPVPLARMGKCAPAEKSFGDMADLVNYLTHPPSHVPQSAGSGEMSDVSKARVLFRWI